jgi:tRNA(Ile2) C34 agmatinyltransferase TiaS
MHIEAKKLTPLESMSKTICKTKDADKKAKKQADPKFECAKCGKKVNKDKYVCKPDKL